MSIKSEFLPYLDGNYLMAPNPTNPHGTGSDNGPMFTSEFYIILKRNKELSIEDAQNYHSTILFCVGPKGMLNRVPEDLHESGQEGVDDYYAVLNGCFQLSITNIPRIFLRAVFRYAGALNNVDPGKWTFDSFLVRQPQLLCAMVAAAFPSKVNPLHYAIRLIAYPLFLYSAVVIATSCIGASPTDADSRRLSWHLVQTLKTVSITCYLASLLWYKRLYATFPNGMKDVAALYYKPAGLNANPYSEYWVS